MIPVIRFCVNFKGNFFVADLRIFVIEILFWLSAWNCFVADLGLERLYFMILHTIATASDASEIIVSLPDIDHDIVGEDFLDRDNVYSVFADYDGEMTVEELLYSINSNVTQINVTVLFAVNVAFAILIVYIILRPLFYFFD